MNLGCTVLMVIFSWQSSRPIDVPTVREKYARAVESGALARNLLDQLRQAPKTPLITGYLGATTILQAKHAINPFNKLSFFNSGKKILEDAIRSSPQNVELRFLRYGIQTNAPPFLNYRSDRQVDRDFLLDYLHRDKGADAQLKRMLESFLKQNGDM